MWIPLHWNPSLHSVLFKITGHNTGASSVSLWYLYCKYAVCRHCMPPSIKYMLYHTEENAYLTFSMKQTVTTLNWIHCISKMMWLLSCFCGTALFCSDALESLAWASAQIHCQCTTNSKVVYPDGNLFTPEELSTANTGMCCHNWLNDWLVRWPIMHSCAIPVTWLCQCC